MQNLQSILVCFFFCLGFLLQTLMIPRAVGEEGAHNYDIIPFPPTHEQSDPYLSFFSF